jgi:hypothetical protein
LFCLLFLLCLLHWLMFCDLVWQSCSTWYICSFSPGLLKCFFISLWQTVCIYYHLGRSLKRNILISPKSVMTDLNKFGEYIDQSVHSWVL